MTCTVDDRRRASDLATRLANSEGVLGVDTLAPDRGHRAGWTVVTTCTDATAPSVVLRHLDRHGARFADATTRGDPPRLVVTATV